jgi:hypothetical protein
MNKEQQELLDEVYKNYVNKTKFPGGDTVPKIEFMYPDSAILTQEEFINKCKTDTEFSEKWGLKIEERKLSLIDRTKILVSKSDNKKDFYDRNGRLIVEEHTLILDEANIPTKLITITYNDKTIESYE